VRELALHLLDIAENSVAAKAKNIRITVQEDTRSDRLKMVVTDDGCGMTPEMVKQVVDPFVTSRTTRKVGLGIPLLKEAAEACNGGLEIQSEVGKGTTLTVDFQRSHIDRMPLGDLAATFLNLLISSPSVNWVFDVKFNDREFVFDDAPIKEALNGCPFTEPAILTFLRQMLESGIESIQPEPSELTNDVSIPVRRRS